MKKIHIRFMKDLKNVEFIELFYIISTTLEKENIDSSSLSIASDRLKPHYKELTRLNYKKLEHPLTQLIQKQVTTRTEYLACLRLTVQSKMLSHKSEERIAAHRLLLWLRAYKKEIFPHTIDTQSSLIKGLMLDRLEKVDIQQATALLKLDELLEAIVEMNAKIMRNILKRLNERNIYIVNGKAIRKEAYKALKVFVTVIEASYDISINDVKREELSQLSLTINEELKVFRRQLRSRNTKRENKKDVEAAVKNLIHEPLEENLQESEKMDLPMVANNQLILTGIGGLPICTNNIMGARDMSFPEKGMEDDEDDQDILPPISKT